MDEVEMSLKEEENREKNPNHVSGAVDAATVDRFKWWKEAIDAATVDRVKRWKEATDSEGNTYYYHDETKEVRWDKPLFFDEVRKALGKRKNGGKDIEKQAPFAVTFQEADERVLAVDQTAGQEEDVVRDVSNPTVSAMFCSLRC